jgi:hypothetical protein
MLAAVLLDVGILVAAEVGVGEYRLASGWEPSTSVKP